MRLLLLALAVLATPAFAQGGGAVQPAKGMHVKGIRHVTMTVGDIDDTLAFYSKAVPMRVVRRYRVSGARFPAALLTKRHRSVEIALVAFPTGFIQLMDFEPGMPAAPLQRPVIGPGYTHICFQSPSSDPAVLRFKAAGLSTISRFGRPDGVDIGGYGVRYAYGTDLNGIMIENESLDAPKRSESSWITHIANTVHDRDRMLRFYATVTGQQPHRTIEQSGRPRLDDVANIDGLSIRGGWIKLGNMEIEVWEYVQPRTPPPTGTRKLDEIGHSQFALEVDDLAAQTARLKREGVQLVGGAVSIGGWQNQFALDPEGNIFALSSRRSAPAAESVTSLR